MFEIVLVARRRDRTPRMTGLVFVSWIALATGCRPTVAPDGSDRTRLLSFSVTTLGRPAGSAEIRIEHGGRRIGRFTFNDRGPRA